MMTKQSPETETRIRMAARENGIVMPEAALSDFLSTGVSFQSSEAGFTDRWYVAAARLLSCIVPAPDGTDMLVEGGPYPGCWMESTGTISSELLSRFCPRTARSTFELYPTYQRDDGLLPYKILPGGPSYRQIQMVTPLARSVWNHYKLTGADRNFLAKMYPALSRFDDWLADHRDTRGSGGVEAFCTFDTGHDLSPRFWHLPDTTFLEDPAQYDPDFPLLPYIAPDLTANVSCQRKYLALISHALGEPVTNREKWLEKSESSAAALERECWNTDDHFYFDKDAAGRHVKVQSDVLLRVYACEAGNSDRFADALERYLLNTRKFFARYPLTSISMDDPRFDPHQNYNSWAGTTNFLSLARTPHAFEYHGRHTELTWIMQPIIEALARARRFPQNINPWNGEEGYTDTYSPAILCFLDFVERLSGILPRPDGSLWFTGLTPDRLEGRSREGLSINYRRDIDGHIFDFHVPAPAAHPEIADRNMATIHVDGKESVRFPRGLRLITGRDGNPMQLIGMVPRTVSGILLWKGQSFDISLQGNQTASFDGGEFVTESLSETARSIIRPRSD